MSYLKHHGLFLDYILCIMFYIIHLKVIYMYLRPSTWGQGLHYKSNPENQKSFPVNWLHAHLFCSIDNHNSYLWAVRDQSDIWWITLSWYCFYIESLWTWSCHTLKDSSRGTMWSRKLWTEIPSSGFASHQQTIFTRWISAVSQSSKTWSTQVMLNVKS